MALKDRFNKDSFTYDESDVADIFEFFASHPWLLYVFGGLAAIALIWVFVSVFI